MVAVFLFVRTETSNHFQVKLSIDALLHPFSVNLTGNIDPFIPATDTHNANHI